MREFLYLIFKFIDEGIKYGTTLKIYLKIKRFHTRESG